LYSAKWTDKIVSKPFQMIKRKNLEIFFDGSSNIKRSDVILRKKKISFFRSTPALLWLKKGKLQVLSLTKNSMHRKKYF
jgi:hypothetical protein